MERYIREIRSKERKEINIKVKIKGDINNTETMELMEEMKKALIKINHLHDKRVSYKIKNCNFNQTN